MKTLLTAADRSLYSKHVPKQMNEAMAVYYDHGLEPDRDGYYAAHIYARYYSDINIDYRQLMPLFVYMGDPTYANAKALIQSQGIHVPLTALMDHLKVMTSATKTARRRGGSGNDTDYTTVPLAKRKRTMKPSLVKLNTMIALDTLKDIHPQQCDTLWQMVNLSQDEKTKLKSMGESDFRKAIAKILATLLEVPAFKSEELAMTTDPVTVKIEKDTLLYRQMMSWMTNANGGDLVVVLDGLMSDVNLSGFLRIVIVHAMFQAMMYNVAGMQEYASKNLQKTMGISIDPLPYTIQSVTLLDGAFQKQDGMPLLPFYQKYIETLSKEYPRIPNVVIKQITNTASYFEKYYSEDPTQRHWRWKGNFVNKQDLQAKFSITKNPTHAKDMAIRNFVRDAWKADVAIQHNAIFLTCDHSAMIYHKWIVKHEILDRKAIGLFLKDKAFAIA